MWIVESEVLITRPETFASRSLDELSSRVPSLLHAVGLAAKCGRLRRSIPQGTPHNGPDTPMDPLRSSSEVFRPTWNFSMPLASILSEGKR
jgi:hypothetical protein